VAEEAQHGPDEVLLRLRLVRARHEVLQYAGHLSHLLRRLAPERPPVRSFGQGGIEVVIREQAVVAVGPFR
jgi:hypothetical protein